MNPILTPRQQEFVTHYLTTRNASDAARLCGYKDGKNIGKTGHLLLHNPAVRDAIQAHQDKQQAAIAQIEQGRIYDLVEIKRKCDADLADIIQRAKEDGRYTAATAAIGLRLKMHGLLVEKFEGNVQNSHTEWVKKLCESRQSSNSSGITVEAGLSEGL